MKKLSLTLLFAATALFSLLQAQTLVTTDTTLRNVVLEEFTGIHCQYCPDGHARAQALSDANPGRVVLVNIHQGGYAVPSGGEPDYRTIFGDAIAGQTALTGYPAGTVNRHVFSGLEMTAGGTAMGRGNWSPAAEQIFDLVSPVNVGLSSSFDSATRLLTVTVETYYTANSSQATNYINVALLENGIIGPQQVLSTWNTNYTHNHMLRHFITGQWGDTLTATQAGNFTTRIYTYTVPAGFNVANCDVAAYVTETYQEIYTGAQVVADGGTTLFIADATEMTEYDYSAPPDTANYPFAFNSMLAGTEDFLFEFDHNAPANWTVYYSVGSNNYTTDQTLPMTYQVGTQIAIHVATGLTPAIATFTLKISSVSNPLAPPIYRTVNVMSEITDLIINNDSPWGDGGSTYSTVYFEDNYLNGLNAAGNTAYASTGSKMFTEFSKAAELGNVEHLYFNIGWSFPSFNDELIAELEAFLDGGGNLFVSGQDIGWDTWDLTNGGNGTPASQSFYSNYLNAEFLNDGGAANSIMTPLSSDLVYGTLDTSAIVNVYGGAYFYPDQIDTNGISLPIFYYNSNLTKMGGLRATNGTYKVVYIGISVEMISDTNIRKDMIHIAHDWFHGFITGDQLDRAFADAFVGQNYPNPSDVSTTIDFAGIEPGSILEVYDVFGHSVFSATLEQSNGRIIIPTDQWPQGTYFYRLNTMTNQSATKRFVVSH
jgi:hypothetical protein